MMSKNHELLISKKKINVLILCGGYGSRINKITKRTPKPLIKTNNKPFLYFLIKNLMRYNFYNFYLLTHYKNQKFLDFKKKYKNQIGAKITIIKEKKKLDTGGAIINAVKKIKNNSDFFLLNGDTYLDSNFDLIYDKFKSQKKIFIPIIKSKKESNKLNSLDLDKFKNIFFSKKKKYMNSGYCFFYKKNIKDYINCIKCSFENLILKESILNRKVKGLILNDNFIDIGSYSSLKKINKFIKNYFFSKKILFLDRDNTLNHDKKYTFKIKDLKLIKKNISEIKNQYENFIKIIITNQAGVAKGYFSELKFKLFMKQLVSALDKKKIFISKIYFCPHHKNSMIKKYKRNCNFRKPNTGMIKQALKDLEVKNKKNCIFIGDAVTDRILAIKTKIKYLDQINIANY